MLNIKTLLSVFNEKGTLLKWLQKLEKALSEATVESVTLEYTTPQKVKFVFNFADGTNIKTPEIDLPEGVKGDKGDKGDTPDLTFKAYVVTGEPTEPAEVVVTEGGTPEEKTIQLDFTLPANLPAVTLVATPTVPVKSFENITVTDWNANSNVIADTIGDNTLFLASAGYIGRVDKQNSPAGYIRVQWLQNLNAPEYEWKKSQIFTFADSREIGAGANYILSSYFIESEAFTNFITNHQGALMVNGEGANRRIVGIVLSAGVPNIYLYSGYSAYNDNLNSKQIYFLYLEG